MVTLRDLIQLVKIEQMSLIQHRYFILTVHEIIVIYVYQRSYGTN